MRIISAPPKLEYREPLPILKNDLLQSDAEEKEQANDLILLTASAIVGICHQKGGWSAFTGKEVADHVSSVEALSNWFLSIAGMLWSFKSVELIEIAQKEPEGSRFYWPLPLFPTFVQNLPTYKKVLEQAGFDKPRDWQEREQQVLFSLPLASKGGVLPFKIR